MLVDAQSRQKSPTKSSPGRIGVKSIRSDWQKSFRDDCIKRFQDKRHVAVQKARAGVGSTQTSQESSCSKKKPEERDDEQDFRNMMQDQWRRWQQELGNDAEIAVGSLDPDEAQALENEIYEQYRQKDELRSLEEEQLAWYEDLEGRERMKSTDDVEMWDTGASAKGQYGSG